MKASIEALRQIVVFYDEQGLQLPAVHAATALEAAQIALENGEVHDLTEASGVHEGPNV
ncbi:hypothetical protein [Novosphingobium malaysiense]|uniref:hypothetical protein n=1 Tax=Novosphingobium malaysiense TaxID=1348853 RepID=UPI000AFED937|nr:hypothetical protein [Novosphingobium malaysiense]